MHVHARRHPRKRLYVLEEDNPNSFINEKGDKFQTLLKLSKANIQGLFNGGDKFYEYEGFPKISRNFPGPDSTVQPPSVALV